MRIGCAAYSYRELLQSGAMSLQQFVDACAAMELDGVELTSYYFPSTERAFLNELKLHCHRRGQHILAAAVGSNFTQPDEKMRRDQVNMTLAWIDHSAALGAPCLRVFAGPVADGSTQDEAFSWAVECIQECVERGSQVGVAIALENHGGITGEASQVERFLNAIPGPWFGVNLDFGNFHVDPYAEFARLSGRTLTTHAKPRSRFRDGEAEVDYGRVVSIMRDAGFSGYLSMEYEEAGDPRTAVPEFASRLKAALSDPY